MPFVYRTGKLKPQIAEYGDTKDVPVLRIDHLSIEGVLLGVRQVSYPVSRDAVVKE